jgi:hypothetical protein
MWWTKSSVTEPKTFFLPAAFADINIRKADPYNYWFGD